MTTAARPTFLPALGGFTLRDSNQMSSKVIRNLDLPSNLTLKTRQPGQNNPEDILNRDLKSELEMKESIHFSSKNQSSAKHFIEIPDEEEQHKRLRFLESAKILDADDADDESSEEESSDEEEDDDEDDTAQLMLELEKIKAERLQEQERLAMEQFEKDSIKKQQMAQIGNPLLQESFGNGELLKDEKVKKRWDDGVIFKNQAKDVPEKPKKRFINDLLRSDFHKRDLRDKV